MSRLIEIHEYLLNNGYKETELEEMDAYSVYLAFEIAIYAHRNQFRENGESYVLHPRRCMEAYRKFVGIKDNDCFCIDKDLMKEYGIPYDGMQEICMLHDVVEDTDFTIEELEEIFVEQGMGSYFLVHIKDYLEYITHNDDVDYEDYLNTCMKYPRTALAKMIDLQDNLNIFTLSSFDEVRYDRAKKYLSYIYKIENKYHFLENCEEYKKEFAKRK